MLKCPFQSSRLGEVCGDPGLPSVQDNLSVSLVKSKGQQSSTFGTSSSAGAARRVTKLTLHRCRGSTLDCGWACPAPLSRSSVPDRPREYQGIHALNGCHLTKENYFIGLWNWLTWTNGLAFSQIVVAWQYGIANMSPEVIGINIMCWLLYCEEDQNITWKNNCVVV